MSTEATSNLAPAKPSRLKTFFSRLLSTVLLWAVILGALFSGREWLSHSVFLVIMVGLTVIGLLECFHLVRGCGLPCFRGVGLTGGVVLVVLSFVQLAGWLDMGSGTAAMSDLEVICLVGLILGLCLRQLYARKMPQGLQAVAATLFALLYVPLLLTFIQKIYFYPGVNGTLYLFFFILVTKFSDTGAYLVGSLIGKHKMIPRVSPGKTWEGFGGAILVPVGASLLFAWLAGDRLSGMTVFHATVLGLILSLGAVTGDLVESLFKRQAGIKDSGAYLPGIGGVLDLLDSLLFNAPLMYFYLRFCLAPLGS